MKAATNGKSATAAAALGLNVVTDSLHVDIVAKTVAKIK